MLCRIGRVRLITVWEDNMTRLLKAAVSAATIMLATGAHAETADKRIALSNNYAGNSWRQAML